MIIAHIWSLIMYDHRSYMIIDHTWSSNVYNYSQNLSDFDENWTILIAMMRRCPIQHREVCRSSKKVIKLQMFITIIKFHRILMRVGPFWSPWCVDARFSNEKPVAQKPKNHPKNMKNHIFFFTCQIIKNHQKFFLRVRSGTHSQD